MVATRRPVIGCLGLLLLCMLPVAVFADDGHVGEGGGRFKPNPDVVSPPILQKPIYACADTVVVKGFVPHARLEVFVAGNPNPIGVNADGNDPNGQPVKVSMAFVVGQVVSAVQVVSGVASRPSNQVTVRNYRDDYPSGLPQPVIDPNLCLDCGAAVGVSGVVPGYLEGFRGNAAGHRFRAESSGRRQSGFSLHLCIAPI